MAISLNHTIVPARDKHASAAFIVRILGISLGEPFGHFVPVRVNASTSLDYADNSELIRMGTPDIVPHHYAFAVDDAEFDAIMGRIIGRASPITPSPASPGTMERSTPRATGARFTSTIPTGMLWRF
jgi:hypothetical protein